MQEKLGGLVFVGTDKITFLEFFVSLMPIVKGTDLMR